DAAKRTPHTINLSSTALDVWAAFVNDLGRALYQADEEDAASLAKLEGYAARLALIHHVSLHVAHERDDLQHPISEDSLVAGIELVRWFAREAKRISHVLSAGKEQQERRRLIDCVTRNGGTITARELHRLNKARYANVDAARTALEELVQEGSGSWVKE